MKHYKIAGILIGVHYEHTGYFNNNIEKYRTDELPEYTIDVRTIDHIQAPVDKPSYTYKNRHIHKERDKEMLVVYTKDNAVKIQMTHTVDYKTQRILLHKDHVKDLAEMEYVLSGLQFMQLALYKNRLPLHASAICLNDEAILFAASSGTGKSTHASYWQKAIEGVSIINDDKPLIYKEDNQFMVSGSPWSGKDSINQNVQYPLKAIVFLDRGTSNTVFSLTVNEALKRFMKDAMRPGDERLMQNALDLIDALIHEAQYVRYTVTNHIDSVKPLYDVLYKEENHED